MTLKNYSPKNTILTIDGTIVSSWNSVSVEYEDDRFTMSAAVSNGEISSARVESTLGKISITLPQTSADNAILNLIRQNNEQAATPPNPTSVQLEDTWGNSIHLMAEGKLTEAPTADYGKETAEREWVFMGALEHDVKGN